MKINDIILLKNDLKDTKIGHISSEGMRMYLKLSIELNKYYREFEEKRKSLLEEVVKTKGYDVRTITPEQDKEISDIVIPILTEYINTDVDIVTRILSWDDLYNGILNDESNSNLSLDVKTRLTELLCSEDL